MIKIIMHGCNGKMGQVITKIAEADSKVEIVAGVDQFQGVQNPYPVISSMEAPVSLNVSKFCCSSLLMTSAPLSNASSAISCILA